jgi:hypothetical protein
MLMMLAAMVLPWGLRPLQGATPFPEISELPAVHELPDPLVSFAGKRITDKDEWNEKRRPELKALFQHYMYGYMPQPPGNVSATVDREDRSALGGKARLKEVTLHFGPPGAPPIHLLLVTPNQHKSLVPAFIGLNFCGNHTVLDDRQIALPQAWMPEHCPGCVDHRATDATRGNAKDAWPVEAILKRGYALASAYYGDLEPDHADGWKDGVRCLWCLLKYSIKEPAVVITSESSALVTGHKTSNSGAGD